MPAVMRDRRREIRPSARLQILSVAGALSVLESRSLARSLTTLYVSQPIRWQAFMDDAILLIQAASADDGDFPETVPPEES